MIILAFYLVYIALALLLAWRLFRLTYRRGRLVGLLAAFATLLLTALFLPIPIHGGFTFPLQIALDGLQRKEWQQGERHTQQRREAFQQGLAQRFAAPLILSSALPTAEGWRSGELDNGEVVWLDEASGLLWRPPQPIDGTSSELSLQQAQQYCGAQFPAGHWGLPTEAELALLWQHQGQRLMPGTEQSSVALLAESELQLQLMTQYHGRVAGHALRCVAIAPQAPRRGYMGSDIPLELWNRFQLGKVELYSAPSQEMK